MYRLFIILFFSSSIKRYRLNLFKIDMIQLVIKELVMKPLKHFEVIDTNKDYSEKIINTILTEFIFN